METGNSRQIENNAMQDVILPVRNGVKMSRLIRAGNSPGAMNPSPASAIEIDSPPPLRDSFSYGLHNSVREPLSYITGLRNHPIVKDNLPIVAIVGAYILAVCAVHAIYGIHDKLVIEFYSDWFGRIAVIFSGLFFLFHIWKGSHRQYFTASSVARFLIIFLLAPFFKSTFASFKQTIPLIHDFA